MEADDEVAVVHSPRRHPGHRKPWSTSAPPSAAPTPANSSPATGHRPALHPPTWPALALYALALAVTFGGNIPLNQELADAGTPAQLIGPAAVRESFEGPWARANILRTLACTAALGSLDRAVLAFRRGGRITS